MATSIKGYTTFAKVKEVLGSQVNGLFTEAVVNSAINRMEGVIDTRLKITTSGSHTGGNSFTWNTLYPVHWVVEGAATYGAALQLCGPSVASWNTLDQLINAQNLFANQFKIYMDLIESEDFGDFIVNE